MNVFPVTLVQVQPFLWETERRGAEDEGSGEKFRQQESEDVNNRQVNMRKSDKELDLGEEDRT